MGETAGEEARGDAREGMTRHGTRLQRRADLALLL